MKLTTLSLYFVLTIIAAVQGVHIRGFTSFGCSGQQWICFNIPAGRCCGPFPRPILSMRWSLPASTRGIGYVGRYCTGQFPDVYGPRVNSCFNYRGQTVHSAKWQQGTCTWKWKRSILFNRQDETCAVPEGCAEPDVVIYQDKEGIQYIVKVPPSKAETVADYLDKKDFRSLLQFSRFKGNTTEDKFDQEPSVDQYNVEAITET